MAPTRRAPDNVKFTEPLYTMTEASRYLGVAPRTFWEWVHGQDPSEPLISGATGQAVACLFPSDGQTFFAISYDPNRDSFYGLGSDGNVPAIFRVNRQTGIVALMCTLDGGIYRSLTYNAKTGLFYSVRVSPGDEQFTALVAIDPQTGQASQLVDLGRAAAFNSTFSVACNPHGVVYLAYAGLLHGFNPYTGEMLSSVYSQAHPVYSMSFEPASGELYVTAVDWLYRPYFAAIDPGSGQTLRTIGAATSGWFGMSFGPGPAQLHP